MCASNTVLSSPWLCRIPGSLVVVLGTSHALPLEKPALVNQLLLNFLAEEQSPKYMLPGHD
ncbi:MAG: alpha/beta hydrolase [Pseudonocardiales bacterium]|nr:alpha/beta hydrolase [Pseudonocardiales bacterium]MBV9730075.1 alpha/beta hydrolase [Pseudonocardiales bacterium]